MLRIWRIACLGLLLIIGGCASKPVDPNDETLSIVYGHFDMTDAPSGLDWVSLKAYTGKQEFYNMDADEGLFMHVGIEPGSYQVHTFGGMGGIPLLTRKPYVYNFGSNGRNDTATRIKNPGIYYLGAFKYVHHRGGWFKAATFDMEPNAAMSEKEVLRRVIERLETDKSLKLYTRQLALARKRLASLK